MRRLGKVQNILPLAPSPGNQLALPLSPHTAVPTVPVDRARHVSPNQTQLWRQEGKGQPWAGLLVSLLGKSWWPKPEEAEVRDQAGQKLAPSARGWEPPGVGWCPPRCGQPVCRRACGGPYSVGRRHRQLLSYRFQLIRRGSTRSPCRGLALGRCGTFALPTPRPCLLKTCLIEMAQHPPLHLPHTLGASCSEIAPSSALPSVPYRLCLDALPLPGSKSLGHATPSLCPTAVISWLLPPGGWSESRVQACSHLQVSVLGKRMRETRPAAQNLSESFQHHVGSRASPGTSFYQTLSIRK